MMSASSVFIIHTLLMPLVTASLLPSRSPGRGVGEHVRYQKGDAVPLWIDSLTSIHTQLFQDYYDSGLPVCRREGRRGDGIDPEDNNNYWSWATNHKMHDSPYQINMLQDRYCEPLCQLQLQGDKTKKLTTVIKDGYHHNWLVDGLPAAAIGVRSFEVLTKHYAGGFPVGFVDADTKNSYVFNHVNIMIDYSPNPDDGSFSVVGVAVQPMSVSQRYYNDSMESDINVSTNLSSTKIQNDICGSTHQHAHISAIARNQLVATGETVLFTYDVIWRASELLWDYRWDLYLSEDNLVPDLVHWYSITNNFIVIVAMAVFIAVILLRNIHSDLNYESDTPNSSCAEEKTLNDKSSDSTSLKGSVSLANDNERKQELEEKGWKLITVADAFGPPPASSSFLLAACCGVGAQLLCTAFSTISLLMLGVLLDPTTSQDTFASLSISFGPFGLINGFVTGQLCKIFGYDWRKATMWAMYVFPAVTMSALLLVNDLARTLTPSYDSKRQLQSLLLSVGIPSIISAIFTYVGARVGHGWNLVRIVPDDHPDTILLGMIFHQRRFRKMKWCQKGIVILLAVFFFAITVPLAIMWCIKRCLVRYNCWSLGFGRVYVLLTAGAISLAVIYVEIFFLMVATWMYQYYEVFFFLFLVTCIELAFAAQSAILFGYYQLTEEGSYSWWWQFASSGAVSIWLVLYSFFWYATLEASGYFAPAVYFTGMLWASLVLFLITGFVGVAGSIWFVNKAVRIAQESGENDSTKPLVNI